MLLGIHHFDVLTSMSYVIYIKLFRFRIVIIVPKVKNVQNLMGNNESDQFLFLPEKNNFGAKRILLRLDQYNINGHISEKRVRFDV